MYLLHSGKCTDVRHPGYLIYIGFKALKSKPNYFYNYKISKKDVLSNFQALRIGFITNGLNPKATLFFLSLFTVVINVKTPLSVQFGYGIYMSIATTAWFAMISLVFGHDYIRNFFKKSGHWFERVMGATLILLGLKLAVTSHD